MNAERESLDYLAGLLGKPLLNLHAPALEVKGVWYVAQSLSLSIKGGGFLVLCAAQEDPAGEISSACIKVEVHAQPKDIPLVRDGERMIIGRPASRIQLGPPPSPVERIEVLRAKLQMECICGVVFALADGRRVGVETLQEKSEVRLRCTLDPLTIEKLCSGSDLRITLK